MPHIIVEYAEAVFNEQQLNELLVSIHHNVVASDLFDESHVKTRSYAFKHFTHAGDSTPYIHVQARIKSGRDLAQKKQLSGLILSCFKTLNLPSNTVVTVEMVDMDRDTYAKYTQA